MIPVEAYIQTHPAEERAAPLRAKRRLVDVMFGDLVSAAVTLVLAAGLLWAVPQLLSWAVTTGVWTGDGAACRDAGACWAFLREKAPFILFGIYPPDERWRPILVIVLVLALALWSLPRRHWTRGTLGAWLIGIVASLLLMAGGVLGLEAVPTGSWGGLPITLLLTILSLSFAFPLAVALALGRRSKLTAIRWLSIGFIELVRGVPLLSLLFIASLLLPLMLPAGLTVDNLLRALVALTLSAAAYLAEVLRGGLQSLQRGQEEAARALGLKWSQTMRLVVLPQAIRAVIPPLTSTVVVVVKNTSLVLIVGLFDLLSTGRASLNDPAWPAPYAETYLFIALIYFVICYGISRYSLHLENVMNQGYRR